MQQLNNKINTMVLISQFFSHTVTCFCLTQTAQKTQNYAHALLVLAYSN